MKSNLFFVLPILFLLSCGQKDTAEKLPYYNSPDFTPHWFEDKDSMKKNIAHTVGSFSCFNQEGKIITEQHIQDKIHVANFFFTTCPGICPRMTNQFERIQQHFRKDDAVMLLSFSVTPDIDSIQKLAEYAQKHQALSDKWHLLTGNKNEIYTLARKSYFAEQEIGYDKDSTRFLHSEYFILVDPGRYIRGIYNGTDPEETNRLIADIHKLKEED
jgi:protein SCO1/2